MVSWSISNRVLESPGWKTFFSVVIPIVVGVLSGTFVAEISTPSGLDWAKSFHAWSFYGLVAMALATYVYYRATYLNEVEIERFRDDDYCRAYMRSKCLPEAAERYKEHIRTGDGGQLAAAMDEFERILK